MMSPLPPENASLAQLLTKQPYQAYTYSYPHKTAYRAISPPLPLNEVWRHECLSQLFLYVHVPFCTYRCGFCNLFALARPSDAMVQTYLSQVKKQLSVTMQALAQAKADDNTSKITFHRFALGGGTPSYLSTEQLDDLLTSVQQTANLQLTDIPAGIEVSPETVSRDKMHLLASHGIDRVSMGVQSFSEQEVGSLIRPQQNQTVYQAVDAIRQAGIGTLNLDLIYGIDGQTEASFLRSLDSTLALEPEEIYLYPLYVRPKTGLDKVQNKHTKHANKPHSRSNSNFNTSQSNDHFKINHIAINDKLALYQMGRDYLLTHGYQQVSMRMFAKTNASAHHITDNPDTLPPYRCQEDGMIGIGCGARSYTQAVHYAHEYGVSRHSVHQILQTYLSYDKEDFAYVNFGYQLNRDEQRRRYVIQSLMLVDGLDRHAYQQHFGSDCLYDLPQLNDLLTLNLATLTQDTLTLTADGLAYADTIGPWLISDAVRQRMDSQHV